MKKVAFLLVCVLYGLKCLIANPVAVPSVRINEIMFDSEQGWMLELVCYGGEKFPFVKMTVSSSSGSAESKYLPVWEGDEYYSQLFVLTRDSMESSLDINPLGDIITIDIEHLPFYYEEEFQHIDDVLIFGKFSGSQIKAPLEGQSIGYAGYNFEEFFSYYAKTNEPTIGAPNDVSKMYGTLTGKIYDKNNQVVLSNDSISFLYWFDGYPYNFMYPVPIEEGTYSIKILANHFSSDYVYISNKKVKIKPITIDVEPDATIEQDIYLGRLHRHCRSARHARFSHSHIPQPVIRRTGIAIRSRHTGEILRLSAGTHLDGRTDDFRK